MKKATIKAIASIIGGLIVFTIAFFIFQSSPSTSQATMSEEEAERLALEQYQGDVLSVEYDDGRYEIEIKGDVASYELKLDAETGEILSLEEKTDSNQVASEKETNENATSQDENRNQEKDDSTNQENNETTQNANKNGTKNVVISDLDAMEIAHDRVPNATMVEFELDSDDGQLYYEIEMHTDDQEIDLEIDAYTGEIIMYSFDQLEGTRQGYSDIMTIKEAREIALAEDSEAVIKEINLDRDDGKYYYEVEMKTSRYEIELDIDAQTGEIVELEYDDWD
ncbi:PepSY domain-containing protein [Amphibacillus sp. Q70]|uniref:PepSY domain-containing protein n=1 Tax=Amphibacillus sp. Q70 TaxID=3453416 RepID=UPI003F855213